MKNALKYLKAIAQNILTIANLTCSTIGLTISYVKIRCIEVRRMPILKWMPTTLLIAMNLEL